MMMNKNTKISFLCGDGSCIDMTREGAKQVFAVLFKELYLVPEDDVNVLVPLHGLPPGDVEARGARPKVA